MRFHWARLSWFLLGWAGPVSAEALLPGARLVVENPPASPSCVPEDGLSAKVQAQLTPEARAASGLRPLELLVVVERSRTTLTANLRVTGRTDGLRQIESARCDALTDALAVTLAMILSQEATAREPVPTSDQAGPSNFRGPTSDSAPPEPAPEPKSSSPASMNAAKPGAEPLPDSLRTHTGSKEHLEPEWRLWAAGAYGSPSSLQLELGGELGLRPWGLRFGSYWHPAAEVTIGEGRLERKAVGGALAACYGLGDVLRLGSCLRGSLGAEWIEPFDLGQNAKRRRLAVATLGPTLALEMGTRWVLALEVQGQAALLRDIYVLENSSVSTAAPRFVLYVGLRIALSTARPSHP